MITNRMGASGAACWFHGSGLQSDERVGERVDAGQLGGQVGGQPIPGAQAAGAT